MDFKELLNTPIEKCFEHILKSGAWTHEELKIFSDESLLNIYIASQICSADPNELIYNDRVVKKK